MSAEWTADDLPEPVSGAEYAYRDAALEWLNEHHPKPVPYDEGGITGPRLYMPLPEAWRQPPRDFSGVGWKAMYERGIEKRVEVLNRAARAERERDELREHVRNIGEGMVRAQNQRGEMRRERDEWKARAEAAEARTAPAVTRDEILNAVHGNETGIYGLGQASAVADVVWSLLSGSDPAVYVVRDEHLPAVHQDSDGTWQTGGRAYGSGATADGMRNMARLFMEDAAGCEAIARTIEAEVVVDPVEAKARAEADRRYSGDPNHAFIEGALWALGEGQ